jgi:hypothetical protein
MKKLAASLLLLIYFTVTTGFVVSVHYCMNKVNGVAFGDSSDDKCSKCGMTIKDSDGCCKNDVKVVKMVVDQAFAKEKVADFSISLLIPVTKGCQRDFVFNPIHENYPLTHGPPLGEQDTYLYNCVFRL